jgi:hypothetical protein
MGGFLPATADSVARYLADHAESLSLNTLKQRLAALATWHKEQAFVDPTKAPLVKKYEDHLLLGQLTKPLLPLYTIDCLNDQQHQVIEPKAMDPETNYPRPLP